MADIFVVGLGLLIVVLLVAILALLARTGVWRKERGLDEATLAARVAASIRESGLSEDLGQVRQMAQQMGKATQDLTRVFQVQQQRGQLGELQLEAVLADLVPRDRLHVRSNFALIGTPDAAIETREGLVCIDSKFPLDQYREYTSASEAERDGRSRLFFKAVRGHLDAIAAKYVRPDAGTTPFAIAYIPSEAVYTFIHQNEPGLGREYALRGVLLASPSTLTTHVALVVKGVQAEVLSQRVELVQRALQRLERDLGGFREAWEVLRRHIKNANDQGQKVDAALGSLDSAYRQAANLGTKNRDE